MLIKKELYKIFKNKAIWILAAVISVLLIFSFAMDYRSFEIDRSLKYNFINSMEGEITQAKAKAAEDVIRSDRISEEALKSGTLENFKRQEYLNVMAIVGGYSLREADIKTAAQNMGSSGGYERRSNLLFYNMMKSSMKNEYYYTGGWDNIINYTNEIGSVIAAIFIVLGLHGIFTGEYTSKMDSIILSTKSGRAPLLRAKFVASAIYTSGVCIFFETLNIIGNFSVYGVKGWNSPLYCISEMSNTPYNINLLQYCIIQKSFHIAGAVLFCMLVLAFSSVCRNRAAAFFGSGIVFFIPYLLNNLIPVKNPLTNLIVNFSFPWLMKVNGIFWNFRVYNIVGVPVMYSYAAVVFMLAAFAVLICFSSKNFVKSLI